MGTLAIDGSRVKANASKHKADETDRAEDEEFGSDFRGEELPQELQRSESRRAAIRAAIEALKQEQAAKEAAKERGKGRKKKTQSAADVGELIPTLDKAEKAAGLKAKRLLADAGYKSEAYFVALEARAVDAYVSLGRRTGRVGPGLPVHEPARDERPDLLVLKVR